MLAAETRLNDLHAAHLDLPVVKLQLCVHSPAGTQSAQQESERQQAHHHEKLQDAHPAPIGLLAEAARRSRN